MTYQLVEIGTVGNASLSVLLALHLILELDLLRVDPVQLAVLVEV